VLTPEPQLAGAGAGLGGGAGNVTATLARADTIGTMSVPASWSTSSGNPVTALSGSGLRPSDADEPAGSKAGMPGIPGLPGGTISRPSGVVPRYGARITVMARPPAAG
jgi:PPE-repeat protein